MVWYHRLGNGARGYIAQVRKFNANIRLLLLASALSCLAQGIFSVDFNLYILSLGIKPDGLGKILSAAPIAHMLAAIPIGFFAEWIGFRKAFLVIYSLTGISLLAQVATPDATLITAAAFLGGLAISGDFVVRLPFLSANVEGSERTHVFSIDAILSGITFAGGALLAGFLPNAFAWLSPDLTTRYRMTLYLSGVIMILAVLPVLLIKDLRPKEHRRISLSPYLWGIDRFTVNSATIEFFLGLTMGLFVPFMNIVFVFHLNTSREFFSTVEAFAFIPTMIAALLAPVLAVRLGIIRAITISRFILPVAILILSWTVSPFLGAGAYWAYKAVFSMSQSMWFAFGMATAAPKAKAALSAWMDITFQLGMAIAATLTGGLLAVSNYAMPFYLAAGSAAITGVLTHLFMGSRKIEAAEETLLG